MISNKTAYAGSDRTYQAKYGGTTEKDTVWINRHCTMICAGDHPDKGKYFIKTEVGQLCLVEGKYYRIGRAMNDNFKFEPVTAEEVAA